MSRNCPTCHTYLGAATKCPKCAPSSAGFSFSGFTTPQPDDEPAPDAPVSIPSRPGRSGVFSARGTVTGSDTRDIGAVPGATTVRMLLAIGTLTLVVTKVGPLLVQSMMALVFTMMPLFIIILLGLFFLSKAPGGLGCLGVFMGMGAGFGRNRRPKPGHVANVDTGTSEEQVLIAADPPIQAGDEVVVTGPFLAGRRHAWLIQCVSPRPYTRVGRGVPAVVFAIVVLVPLCVWLLTL